MLTSAKELPHIVATVRKPIVKLAINRHNNKYSYTAYVYYSLKEERYSFRKNSFIVHQMKC